ncbi:MAG: DUF3179 domain-containing (seleno)protein [Paracoccaceae bacterium]
MQFTRRRFAGLALASTTLTGPLQAQDASMESALEAQLFGTTSEHLSGLSQIAQRGNPDMAAGLILSQRFSNRRADNIAATLEKITGETHGTSWFDWMLWQERNPQIVPHPSFADYMRRVHLQIDPNFDQFLRLEHLAQGKPKIRIEEIAWGGVVKDGIPSLDNPDLVDAADAEYMRDDDLVFGVSINGDVRAYPLRIMGWHEMFNEVIGGVPVALAYCTLCGSGILFETQLEGRAKPLVFGSSGFLYRSNKLMFDRETDSLWNQFTGKPVIGPLVDSGIELKQRPVVITSWKRWKNSHANTKVLSVDTGHRRDYGSGVVYSDYFGSGDLMFPADVDQRDHKQKDYVFAVREFGAARAWPVKAFAKRKVINDAIADKPLVLLGDADTRSVRAYERGAHTFQSEGGSLTTQDGGQWRVSETALTGPDGQTLPRVAGHIAYWFAWNNYLGDAASVFED